ncbi:MAG TPA: TonB family protein [Bacteroidales bacterium]|nr:TonB family protein [Bacteroidales bacterium]
MKIDKDRRRGMIGTIMIHALLLIFLLVVALRTPLPLPGEEGVEVNLGFDEQGIGNIQSEAPPPKSEPIPVQEKIVQPPADPEPVEEEIITQDIEEAPVIEEEIKEEKPEKEPEKEIIEEKKPDPIPDDKVEEKPIEEIIDSIFIEEEPIEEVPIEEPKPIVNKRALYTGSSSDTKGTNQGITAGAGDQGKPHGYKESDDYSGLGGSGNGISFSLGGRGSLFLEKPTATFREQGTVVVSIWVDQDGNVKKAHVSAKGTNILDQNLRKIAVDAAYNSTFVKDNNAAELQRGTITYNFILMK